jgi:thiamine-monophosphate kinase
VARIRQFSQSSRRGGVKTGIGDDCAVLDIPAASQLLMTTDLCVENVHFRRAWHPAHCVGHRCLARGLSDIAAMGGKPMACFLSLGLPPGLPQRWFDDFFKGLLALGGQFGVQLAGGDLSASSAIVADIVVAGTVPLGKALLRSGARPGDFIYVTGELGGSAAVLKRLYSGKKVRASGADRHFYPMPRLEAGAWLLRNKVASAAIDLSDGLSVDLAHICEESHVAAIVDAAALPVAGGANLELALHGGDDYELLFTTPPGVSIPRRIAGVPVAKIGEILTKTRSRPALQIREETGRLRPLPAAGWEHFKKSMSDR